MEWFKRVFGTYSIEELEERDEHVIIPDNYDQVIQDRVEFEKNCKHRYRRCGTGERGAGTFGGEFYICKLCGKNKTIGTKKCPIFTY